MKICTYNIWNSDINYNCRLELLLSVINNNDIDILGLQEVRDVDTVDYIKTSCGFEYSFWKKYSDCEEGLAILSRYPITHSETNWDNKDEIHNSGVMRVVIDCNGINIGLTNVHLDYKSALNREIEIVEAMKKIDNNSIGEYELILGDFNSYPNSSIYRYLTGQQSLNNHGVSYIDLAVSYSIKNKIELEVTLDFNNNPRWDDEKTLDVPGRFDWILLKNPYPKKSPLLNEVKIIGHERVNGITPSDHYGVFCDIDF